MCWVEETRIKKTRKEFRCEWCWQRINKGEACVRHRGIVDDRFFVARLHPECANLLSSTFESCETYIPGEGERPIQVGVVTI